MQARYLVIIHEVNCAVPLRDHLSNLITHTQYLADRNIYAAVLTRQQWDKLREEYWATGRQCDHGRLVPDIDFVASDGKMFLDFEACRKHEADIGTGDAVEEIKRTWATVPDEYRVRFFPFYKDTLAGLGVFNAEEVLNFKSDLAKRSEFIAAKICADVVQYNNGEFCNAATEYRFQEWLTGKSQEAQGAGEPHKLSEAGAVPAPATTSAYNPDPLTETATGLMIACRTDGPPVTLTTDSVPTSLEDRMLVVVGSNYMNLSLVASLLKADVDAVRAIAVNSDKFSLSGSGKSICKATAP